MCETVIDFIALESGNSVPLRAVRRVPSPRMAADSAGEASGVHISRVSAGSNLFFPDERTPVVALHHGRDLRATPRVDTAVGATRRA